jgi:hypothetical protein
MADLDGAENFARSGLRSPDRSSRVYWRVPGPSWPIPGRKMKKKEESSVNWNQVVPVRDVKAYGGSWGIGSLSLNIGIGCKWVIRLSLWPLYPRLNSHLYLLDRKLGGPHSRSGRFGEDNILPLPGIKPLLLSRLVLSLVIVLTELPRLL